MKCPQCQTENRDEAEFCKECGISLQSELVCPECGHPNTQDSKFCDKCGRSLIDLPPAPAEPSTSEPTSFVKGRYQVKKKLGEGGKKKVYLVTDTVLDRDVAFNLIKSENMDEGARKRVTREARAMAKLGDHPNIMAIYDMALEQVISIGKSVCLGLEFAHSKGIIHRDIKPGNVWMSEDGTVKIGDFGLAMVADISRLTHEGMMVGTYYYMPPEQAMGGEITTKADLYSLGAMLYEMVTGRPPFVGDDSVAIIGQHINTPPISPTWHRGNLPPAIETLILQLLEKDPEKRPSSARDVHSAFESIEKGDIKESTIETQAPTENPLYRRYFVGRENELKQLHSAFDGAISGQGALVMVVGEPGIGKTSICDQLSTFVTLRGGKTLIGHCYEEGSLSIPYIAFVEALRSYVLDREVEDLRKELGTGATDVARIVSEIREKLKIKPREAENPEEDRYRLMQSVTSFLSNAATVKPMLIILEDLHDADKGTLEMLSYVSRNLNNKRLLIVGTYRDIEVDRNHPLSAALAELRRVSTYGRVLLRGLNVDEVKRMLESITREDVPLGLADAVHRQTEGNPLFVQEVVRYLTEEKLLRKEGGKMITAGTAPLDMNIPEGLRDVIGRRLSNLSEECNRLLSIAAVIGREFRPDILQKVSGLSEEEVFTSLEAAKRVAVVEERSAIGAAITYRFAHAFFRTVLYEENIAPRRIRLHQQVARVLEEVYSNRLQEHAAELAEHFSYSTEVDDLTKAVSYGEMAAKRALSVYAYGENVRLLEHVLKVQEVLAPDDKEKQCDLLRSLSYALTVAGEPRRALDVELPAALSLAEFLNDHKRSSRVCLFAMVALANYGTTLAANTPEFAQWAERADRYAAPDTVDRAWADAFLGTVQCGRGQFKEGLSLLRHALDLSRKLGNNNAFWMSAFMYSMYAAPQQLEERVRLAEELVAIPRNEINMTTLGTALFHMASTFLEAGQRQRAEEFFGEVRELSERSAQPILQLLVMRGELFLATLDGRLEEAVEISRYMQNSGEEMGLSESASIAAAFFSLTPYIFTGRFEEALQLTQFLPSPQETVASVICLANLGRNTDVLGILEDFVLKRSSMDSDEDKTPAFIDAMLLEAAVILKHKEAAEFLLHRLAGTGIKATSYFCMTCILRHLGAAAALLGRPEEARIHYQEAIKVATAMRFRPELALTRLQIAELLLENYPDEKSEAVNHLDFTIAEFRDMKMQPSLERALKHKEILKA